MPPPAAAVSSSPPPPSSAPMTVVYARRDGRTAFELRGKEMKLSEMTAFDGSSWYAQGQTAVTVSIHGPTIAKSEEYDTCIVQVRVQHAGVLAPAAGGAERALYEERKLGLLARTDALALESLLESTINAAFIRERFPRCVLVVDVVVVQDDGSLPAVALNAVMCALLDAGLPCRTTMAAVCVAVVTRGGGADLTSGSPEDLGASVDGCASAGCAYEYLLDPTSAEESLGDESAAPASSAAEKAVATGASAIETSLTSPTNVSGRHTAQPLQEPYRCVSTGVFAFSNPACGGGLLAQLMRSAVSGRASPGVPVQAYAQMLALAEKASVVLFEFFQQCSVAE